MRSTSGNADAGEGPAPPPRLLIDGRRMDADGFGLGERLLGLSLAERLARAARRSGYGRIFVLAPPGETAPLRALLSALADVVVGEAPPAGPEAPARTVAVSGDVLGERTWLEAAAALDLPADGIVHPFAGVALCGPAVPLDQAAAALTATDAVGWASDTFTIRSRDDLAAARQRLLRGLGKGADGFMERHVERPLSRRLSARLALTPVTPNQMTLVSAVVGLAAAPFFLSAAPLWQTAGALLFIAHAILDGCDGELARLKFQESRWGGILDFWVDNLVHSAIFGCMAAGWSLAIGAGWPLALGAAAVLGTLGSAGFVYWRVMRPKRGEGPLYTSVSAAPSGKLAGLLDSLSRRDFIYLVLILSLPGKAAWFLALAAIGAPVFFVMLLVVAARDRGASAAGG
jgi:1L-myo-inositol 1-phosphate cytidylyltransferase / CDP-L-myo-inositol myo-inositolphosphotransferase